MTASEALDTFGSTIPFKYFNGTGYTDSTFTYHGLYTDPITVYSESDSYTYQGNTFLEYWSPDVEETTNPDYITVDIAPSSTISNTMQIHTVIALSDGYNSNSYTSNTYQSPSWDWFYDGTSYHLENDDLRGSGTGQYAYIRTSGSARNFLYVCADFTASAPTYGYTTRATFSGNAAPYQNPIYRLLIGVPYVDSLASGETGVVTSPSGGTDINVNIDMGPTNQKLDEQTGLLQQIKQGIQGFFDTIKNALVSVFVPSSDFMDEFKADMQDLLEDHLGGLYQAISKIDDIFSGFGTVTSKQTIHINAVEIPLAGETLTLGNWDVPLKRNELSILYDGIAFIIDFLATAAFLNMCRNKLEIFLNPDSEVITE